MSMNIAMELVAYNHIIPKPAVTLLVMLTDPIVWKWLTIFHKKEKNVGLLLGRRYHSYGARLWSINIRLHMLQKLDA